MEQPAGTRNWFKNVEREFARYFRHLAGQPITYVEVGCWLGGSAEWVCREILTHAQARGYGIDPYAEMFRHPQEQMDAVRDYAAWRLRPYPQWSWLYGRSRDRLAQWDRGPIHALYIDGDHSAEAIVEDFKLALPHLVPGSIVVFDDYSIGLRKDVPTTPTACQHIMAACPFLARLGARRQFAVRVMREPGPVDWPESLPEWKPVVPLVCVHSGELTSEQAAEGRRLRRERWRREAEQDRAAAQICAGQP